MEIYPILPFDVNFFSQNILKSAIKAHKSLSELKGYLNATDNLEAIVYFISLIESRECIKFTNKEIDYNEIFKNIITDKIISKDVKEIINYQKLLLDNYSQIKNNANISVNKLLEFAKELDASSKGIRKSENFIVKELNNKLQFTPPQSKNQIIELLNNLFEYLKVDVDLDDLIKIALGKYQFEAICPFYQGNLKLSNFIFILNLIAKSLLDYPALPFSKYLNKNKDTYFILFQNSILSDDALKKYSIFILDGVAESATYALNFINEYKKIFNSVKISMQKYIPKIYSDKLLSLLFNSIYLKNETLQKELAITRNTATKYFKLLVEFNFLESEKIGKEHIYKNAKLVNLLDK